MVTLGYIMTYLIVKFKIPKYSVVDAREILKLREKSKCKKLGIMFLVSEMGMVGYEV